MGSAEMMITLVWLGAFAMVVLTVYFIMKYRAVTPRSHDLVLPPKRKSDWQKPGIVVIGVGLGVLISGILTDYNYFNNDAVNLGIVVISTGISMIVANVLDNKKSNKA